MDELLFDAWPEPELSAKSRKPALGNAVPLHRDNLDYVSGIDDGFFDLIVTSPPYNIGKSYEKRSSLEFYLTAQGKLIRECVRTLSNRGSICWQVGNHVIDGEVVPLDAVLYPIFKSQD